MKTLDKYAEKIATKRAKTIDDFIGGYIPKWQTKIMLKFPFTVKLFGWTVEERPNWNEQAEKFGQKIELKRYGKLIATLTII